VSAKVQISYEIFAKLMEIFSKLMEIFAKLMEIFSPVSPSKKVALKTGNYIQRNVEIVSVLFYIASVNDIGLRQMSGVLLDALLQ
jgi:hypothetical protein